MEAQGCKIEKNRAFQDNKSTIPSEENGKQSSGKRTRASHTRCSTITDQVKRLNVVGPADEVLADHMTNGSQGAKLSEPRRRVMGMDPEPFKETEKPHDFGLIKQ